MKRALLASLDIVLRWRIAWPIWVLLFWRDIVPELKVLRESFPGLPFQISLVDARWGERRRIVLTRPFTVSLAEVLESPGRRSADKADQSLVDAVLSGGYDLEEFLASQERDPTKPYWTQGYSRIRVRAVEELFAADPRAFRIAVHPGRFGPWEVADGHHRLRICQLGGLEKVSVVVSCSAESIDFRNPSKTLLKQVRAIGSDAGLGDRFSHAARATGVAIMVSNSIGVKRPQGGLTSFPMIFLLNPDHDR